MLFLLNISNFENEIIKLPRNIGKKLPTKVTSYRRRTGISARTLWQTKKVLVKDYRGNLFCGHIRKKSFEKLVIWAEWW